MDKITTRGDLPGIETDIGTLNIRTNLAECSGADCPVIKTLRQVIRISTSELFTERALPRIISNMSPGLKGVYRLVLRLIMRNTVSSLEYPIPDRVPC